MKTIYTYHFNDNELFTCTIERQEKRFNLEEEQALESLKLLDEISFDRLQVYKHSVRLYQKDCEIHLRDLNLFIQNQLDVHIPHLYQKIEIAMKNYLREEARKKTKKNKKIGQKSVFKVTTGAILTAALLIGIKSNAKTETFTESPAIESNLLKQDNLQEKNNPFSVSVEKIPELEMEQKEQEKALEESKLNSNPAIEENGKVSEEIPLDNSKNAENIIYLNYEKSDDLVKKEHTFKTYEELANWCGEKWGMSPNLILMQATQESGGMEENLMQIVWEKWASDEPIRAYNFRDSKYETFLLKNNPTEEEKAKYTCITEEDLKNPKTNMSIGCVLLRKSAEYMDYHIMAALQCYNLGYGNMDAIFQKMEAETGQTRDEILSDQTNLSFYDYTYVPGEGDPYYLSHIFQFIDEYGDEITFKHLQNGEVVEERIRIFNQAQSL